MVETLSRPRHPLLKADSTCYAQQAIRIFSRRRRSRGDVRHGVTVILLPAAISGGGVVASACESKGGENLVPNVGHGVFWDDTAGFNERLHTFCESL